MFLTSSLFTFIPCEIQMTCFWKESHRRDIVSVSASDQGPRACSLWGSHVNFDILVKMISARFLH